MTQHSETPSIYSGADITFHDILHGGRLGGAVGMSQYLRNRLNELSRRLTEDGTTEAEEKRILVAMAAMKDAMILISMLTSKTI